MSTRYPPEDSDYRRRADAGHPSSSSTTRRDPIRGETTRDRDIRDPREATRDRRPDERDRDTRMNDVMDTRPDTRTDPRMNSRVDTIRTEPRTANTAAPLRDPRPDPRMLDGRSTDPEAGALFQDPNTGEFYREVRPIPTRSPYVPDDRYDEGGRQRVRSSNDTPMITEPLRPQYSEYFCPGDGIEREVIQHEICKYLGQDATCRPGRDNGRNGYWVKAYRPFTTAMEQSLREDTVKWQRERERRARSGRSQGSYAEMQAREERRRYPGDMEIDDDYDRPRHRDMDPRAVPSGRVPIPVTSGYPPDPGYQAHASYTISSNQPGYPPPQQGYYPGPEREPRFSGGNSTPPSMSRPTQGGYVQPPYPTSRTVPPVPTSIPPPYGDPRAAAMRDPRADMMAGYPNPAYPDPSRSHRR